MLSYNKLSKNILRWGVRISLSLFLLFTFFSPFGNVFQTPYIHAQSIDWAGLEASQMTDCRATGKGEAACQAQIDSQYNTSGQTWQQGLAEMISTVVYVFTVGLGSLLAYIAGYFFNLAVYISLNSTAYALTFLTQGWSSVRDIANMGFIFILIYIAVTVIISAETGKTMQMLVKVVAIALVINFSFFFTRIIIDGGNILAVNFYNATTQSTLADSLKKGGTLATTQTIANGVASAASVSLSGASKEAKDLTAGIMDALQIQTILNDQSFKAFSNQNSGISGFFTILITLSFIYISVGVILGLLAAMFFTIGIKFITRVAVLWIVIISAPLALLMYAMPSGDKYFKEWLRALITYSLYPAIFLFLYLLLINFTHGLIGPSIFAGIDRSTSTGFSYMLGVIATVSIKLGFVMVFLYLIMQASNTVSKLGGSMAQKITARPDAWLRSGIFGTAGGLGRYSFGWAGKNIGESTYARNLAAKPGFGGLLGSTLVRGGRAIGSSSFDARNSTALKANFGKEATGKGGYNAAFDARAKKNEDFVAFLKPTKVQLEEAEAKALKTLTKDQAEKLAQASANYVDARKKAENREITTEALKAERKKYNAVVDEVGIKDKLDTARKAVGEGNSGNFAATLTTRSARNLWGTTSSAVPGYISKADKEAAARIRNPKGDIERLKNILDRSGYKKTSTFEKDEGGVDGVQSGGGGGNKSKSGERAPFTRQAMDKAVAAGLDKQTKALTEAITTGIKNAIPTGTALSPEALKENHKDFLKEVRKFGTTMKTVAKESAKKSSEDFKNLGNKLENAKTPPPSTDKDQS